MGVYRLIHGLWETEIRGISPVMVSQLDSNIGTKNAIYIVFRRLMVTAYVPITAVSVSMVVQRIFRECCFRRTPAYSGVHRVQMRVMSLKTGVFLECTVGNRPVSATI